jgi:hypothetical protein
MKNRTRPKHYQKKLSLYPLKFEEAVSLLLRVKPNKKKKK